MINGGVSYYGVRDGAYVFTDTHLKDPDDLLYDPLGGLGFFPLGLIDTHFANRGREGRFIRLISDTRDQVCVLHYPCMHVCVRA